MTVAIIDYGSGNLRSVAKAFEHVAASPSDVIVTRSPEVIEQASHIVLPGVGAFGDCMMGLKTLWGMSDALEREVIERGKPLLGICVGMQMLFERSHEYGVHEGLGWIKGEVVPLSSVASEHSLKIPHMGWNDLSIRAEHPLMKGIDHGEHAYFVHSYYAACRSYSDMIATVNYGQKIAAVVGSRNIMGAQFHPEKSQETGLKLLRNFLSI